jgi:hypothetical protein
MKGSAVNQMSGTSLVIGSLAFGLFWGRELVDVQPPWPVSLGVHGLSVLLIAFGLIQVQRQLEASQRLRQIAWIAVVAVIVGQVALLPLFAIGLAVFAIILMLSSRRWLSGAAMTAGSLVFMAAYVFGTHIGDQTYPSPGQGLSVVFAAALALIVGVILWIVERLAPRYGLTVVARPQVERVRVVWDGGRQEGPVELFQVTPAKAERMGATEPFGYWVGFVPRSARHAEFVIVAYGAGGEEIGRYRWRSDVTN